MASLIAVLGLGSLCALASPPDPAGLNPAHRISGSPFSRLSPVVVLASGVLPGDTTWSGDVLVTGDVTVPAGATLTVAPGTVVRFAALSDDTAGGQDPSRCELIVHGNLSAEGTSAAPILFTSDTISHAPGDWYGIRGIFDSAAGEVVCRHCELEFAADFISLDSTKNCVALISNSTLHQGSASGITAQVWDGGKLTFTLENSTLLGPAPNYGSEGWDSCGISLRSDTGGIIEALIAGSDISHYHRQGIDSNDVAHLAIMENHISNNEESGIQIDADENQTIDIRANIITDNVSNGIDVSGWAEQAFAINILNNQISRNYAGIMVSNASPLIQGNHISENADGIYLVSGGITQVLGNVIQRNRAGGLISLGPVIALYDQLTENGTAVLLASGAKADLHHNQISDSNGPEQAELLNYSHRYVDARSNYWGAGVTAWFASGGNPKNIPSIFDIFDDPESGFVDYFGWLTSPTEIPTSPRSVILFPEPGMVLNAARINISGTAFAPAGVDRVEVSLDGGQSWIAAEGTSLWHLAWDVAEPGSFAILSRAVDRNGQMESTGPEILFTLSPEQAFSMGTLDQDTTWSGNVFLWGDVTVPSGVQLTILPGTRVTSASWFDGMAGGLDPDLCELVIYGSLVTQGNPDLPILFASETTQLFPQWGGIRFLDSENAPYPFWILQDCLIENAQQAVLMDVRHNASLEVERCQFQLGGHDAVSGRCNQGAALVLNVTDSIFNLIGLGEEPPGSGSAICLISEGDGSRLESRLDGNRITDTNGTGIRVIGYPGGSIRLEVENTAVTNSAGNGIAVFNLSQGSAEITIQDCQFVGNYNAGIALDPVTTGSIRSSTITDNQGSGIYISGYANIQGNLIARNQGGISLYETYGMVAWNTILANQDHGIQVNIASGAGLKIRCNQIEENENGILYSDWGSLFNMIPCLNNLDHNWTQPLAGFEVIMDCPGTLEASYNYWGELATLEMDRIGPTGNSTFILDGFDNPYSGYVDFSSWLPGPIPLEDAPLTKVISPANGVTLSGAAVHLEGYALAPEGVERVEVSADGGQTWAETAYVEPDLKELWKWLWFAPGDGTYTFRTRLVTAGETVEKPGGSVTVTVTNATPINGDLNRDGVVDAADFDLLRVVLSESVPSEPFDPAMLDVNGDGMIDVLDLMWLALLIAG